MAPFTLVMATRNPGKVRELADILEDLGVRLLSLNDFPELPEIPEEGATFADNAAAKARAVARLTGLPALADDSGLEVEALGGRPGVFSARYAQDRTAGRTPTDEDNWRKLLDELQGTPPKERQARFVCEIALAWPDGRLLTSRGELPGFIAQEPRGAQGFGYDPVFWLPEYQATVAELPPAFKNRISHRGKALKRLKEMLLEKKAEFLAVPPQ
ncbi:MAG: XTP/dITP diphosphatase [Desulfobaccales bacterium]